MPRRGCQFLLWLGCHALQSGASFAIPEVTYLDLKQRAPPTLARRGAVMCCSPVLESITTLLPTDVRLVMFKSPAKRLLSRFTYEYTVARLERCHLELLVVYEYPGEYKILR